MEDASTASVTGSDGHVAQAHLAALRDVLSNEVRLIFQWVLYSVVIEATNVFGAVTNIINIVCFIKLGFTEAVNISLLGLAVSDLSSLIALIWSGICYNPAFQKLPLPFDPIEIQYLTAGGPHIIFARVTSCITAFITLERCLCITMPLKVKSIISRSRVRNVIVSIFLVVVGFMLLIYSGETLGEKFSAERNRTIIGLIYADWSPLLKAVVFSIAGVLLELITFATVVVCTFILVVKLRDKTKWRQMSTAPNQTDAASVRDKKVTKMVVVISLLFIGCYTPTCLSLVAMTMEQELSPAGQYRNLFVCLFSVCFALESLNSATNIIIYYNMSSKYKIVLRQMFKLKHR